MPAFHVAPSSKGGDYYVVTYFPETHRYHCECPGYFYRGRCRHVVDAGKAVEAGFVGMPGYPHRKTEAA